MSTYRTVVVGTDGSDTSLRAVDRAGEIAASAKANLVVAMAFFPPRRNTRDTDTLKGEAYKVEGNAPVYSRLRDARDRARQAGAVEIGERAILGSPVESLVRLAEDIDADLLVVGSVGLGGLTGRLLGSVPAEVARRAKTDVLIVHTT